jgi:REP-associated tyrosine transposase
MILGLHFIFSAYGFWLPNDPRGSWSDTVRELGLLRFGPATKADTTRSVARRSHDYLKRLQAKKAIRYPPVKFNGLQARAIVNGFWQVVAKQDYAVHALAVMPDHVHLLMRWDATDVDRIATQFKARATAKLNEEGLHPLARYARANGGLPSPWARKHWCPFIRSVEHMCAAIRYVERNPVKAGFKPQRWRLVTPYED